LKKNHGSSFEPVAGIDRNRRAAAAPRHKVRTITAQNLYPRHAPRHPERSSRHFCGQTRGKCSSIPNSKCEDACSAFHWILGQSTLHRMTGQDCGNQRACCLQNPEGGHAAAHRQTKMCSLEAPHLAIQTPPAPAPSLDRSQKKLVISVKLTQVFWWHLGGWAKTAHLRCADSRAKRAASHEAWRLCFPRPGVFVSLRDPRKETYVEDGRTDGCAHATGGGG